MNKLIFSEPELEVEVYFLKPKEGGRNMDIPPDYRGQFYYDGEDFDALYQFINNTTGKLGEYSNLLVKFVSPFFHSGKFYEGKEILIKEGNKIIGKGKILNVFNDNLKIWDSKNIIEGFQGKIDPYDGDNMIGFRMDFDQLGDELQTLEVGDLIETGEKGNMLIVKCVLLRRDASISEVVKEIQSDWIKKLSYQNQKHRFDINIKNENEWEVKMHFITWHSLYITGTIEVMNKSSKQSKHASSS